jgi:hypothetical protein
MEYRRLYSVWVEGFLATGMEGVPAMARYLGDAAGENFEDACIGLLCDHANFDAASLTVWGCRLFDNEADARKSFG